MAEELFGSSSEEASPPRIQLGGGGGFGRFGGCGGVGETEPADSKVTELVTPFREELETHTGKKFTEFTAVSFRKQVIHGYKYFIKVKIGASEHLHVTIWQRVDGEPNEIMNVAVDKTAEDQL